MPIIKPSRQAKANLYWVKFVFLVSFLAVAACQVSLPLNLSGETPTEIQPEPTMLDPSTTDTPEFTKPIPSVTATPQPTSTRKPTPAPTYPPTTVPTRTMLPFASGPLEIGNSAGGRPLEVFRFGTGDNLRMIVAGIHGGYEWNTTKLAEVLIEYIQQHPELIPPDKTLYILPNFNPDGLARGHGAVGRANDNGVDLNRNFSENWKLDWPRTGCWQLLPISAGEYPFSEPESTALATFLLSHPVDALISYHSAGKGIYPGGHSFHRESNHLASSLAEVSTFPYPGFDTGCETTGMLVDYAAAAGIAAVDLELSTHWDTEFSTNLAVLQAFLAWSFKD